MRAERSNPPREWLYARRWRIFGVTVTGLFMALIDVTIVNVTIPELQRELDASIGTVSWVLNAYNITFAVLLVSMGRLADQFGRKRFFLIGMSVFTLGSLLCALSWSIEALIGFRVVQAVGAGILAPLALATTAMVFPPAKRGLGLATLAVVANVAAAIGPPLGGVIVEWASWHWIFAINVPVGAVGILLALRVMPETFDLTAARSVDWLGMVLIGGAVLSLTLALVEAASRGWGSPLILGLLAASVALTAAFAASQRYGRSPMLTPALVANRQFAAASASFVLFAMAVMGPLFLAVIAFVDLWGYSQIEAALAISPIALLGVAVSPLVGRVADRVQPRAVAIPALLFMAGGLLWLGGFPDRPDYLAVLPPLVALGIGIGAIFPATSVAAMGSISGQELGLGSGVVNMARQVGFALGVALLVSVFSGALSAGAAPGDAFGAGFRVAALAALLAIPFAAVMRRRPADALDGGADRDELPPESAAAGDVRSAGAVV